MNQNNCYQIGNGKYKRSQYYVYFKIVHKGKNIEFKKKKSVNVLFRKNTE